MKWQRVSLVREDRVWRIMDGTSLVKGEWSVNVWSHPDWKPGLKVDVVVKGIDAQGKPFQVHQSNVEIKAAR